MQLEVGSIVEGKVTGITKFGAFVEIGSGITGMVHISEVASSYVKEIRDHLAENQAVKVKVLTVGEDGKIGLSIKKAEPPKASAPAPHYKKASSNKPMGGWAAKTQEPQNFEDMLSKFKQSSDDRMSDIKRGLETKRGTGGRRGHSR